jgi:hypothetical protein
MLKNELDFNSVKQLYIYELKMKYLSLWKLIVLHKCQNFTFEIINEQMPHHVDHVWDGNL